MGRFVNPDNSAFQVALNSPIYVDKTGLLEGTFVSDWVQINSPVKVMQENMPLPTT